MAPDTVSSWLEDLRAGSRVLDPMCGSGVVVRQSAMLGHEAQGFDIDPLAVLMTKVWTRGAPLKRLAAAADAIAADARRRRITHAGLPWIAVCEETREFIEYWFAEPQRSALSRLAWSIHLRGDEYGPRVKDALWLALSRTIITKHVGASLAWDVSHSRPHKVRETNDFDVELGFLRAVARLSTVLNEEAVQGTAKVGRADCRDLSRVATESVDAVVTSPPYLNAIDYMRGHKLSLVWMGHTTPELRQLRSGAIGTERSRGDHAASFTVSELESAVRKTRQLPPRLRTIVHKYAFDAERMLVEMDRVLKPGGKLVLVLGDSVLRGVPVRNSQVFRWIAERVGFSLQDERQRKLANNRRYLPIRSSGPALEKRMKHEVIQAYRARR